MNLFSWWRETQIVRMSLYTLHSWIKVTGCLLFVNHKEGMMTAKRNPNHAPSPDHHNVGTLFGD